MAGTITILHAYTLLSFISYLFSYISPHLVYPCMSSRGVDRVEFLTAMLVQMNELDKEKDIDPWLKRFDELDADGSGALDEEVRGTDHLFFCASASQHLSSSMPLHPVGPAAF